MNILISYLSLYNKKTERSYYTNGFCAEESIAASQTNEPVLRLLEKNLEEKGEKIGRVIPILSFSAENNKCNAEPDRTTYEFFCGLTAEVVGTDGVLCPVREYEDENTLKETGAVIREICGLITADDDIYIDTSGGTRTSANMLQLLAKILEYKGYRLVGSFYANINYVRPRIETTKDFTELTMLADAVNEFVHTGRSYQLSECFKGEKHEEIAELIKYMDEFTDRIQLCSISELDDTLTKMRRQIEKVHEIQSDETKIVILENLLPVIEDKFFKGGSDGIDYCRMIKWCLENGLIQQAVTIYIEKMPKYIFDNRILICDEKYYREFKGKNENNPFKQNTDAVIFYDEFMDSVAYDEKLRVKKLQKAIKEIYKNKNRYTYDNDLHQYMTVFKDMKKIHTSKFRKYIEDISNSTYSGITDEERDIVNYCLDEKFGSFEKMINALTEKEKDAAKIMRIEFKSIPTFDKKIRTAENITMTNCCHEGVTINKKTNIKALRGILFDYIYVKSVRNQINHASDEENLNEQQKKKLEDRGYNVGEFTTRVISDIIKNSVERIESAASAVLKG